MVLNPKTSSVVAISKKFVVNAMMPRSDVKATCIVPEHVEVAKTRQQIKLFFIAFGIGVFAIAVNAIFVPVLIGRIGNVLTEFELEVAEVKALNHEIDAILKNLSTTINLRKRRAAVVKLNKSQRNGVTFENEEKHNDQKVLLQKPISLHIEAKELYKYKKNKNIRRSPQMFGENTVQQPKCNCQTADANKCPAGLPGPKGVSGERGDTGLLGINGPNGPDADSVFPMTSDTGSCHRCPQGAVGQPGPPGLVGMRGLRGPVGKSGCPGNNGAPGSPGEPGPPGLPGSNGRVGPIGGRGMDGRRVISQKGIQGVRGSVGPAGETGNRGTPGRAGKPGTLGRPGKPGPDGLSGSSGMLGDVGQVGQAGEDANYCPCPPQSNGKFVPHAPVVKPTVEVVPSILVNEGFITPTTSKTNRPTESEVVYREPSLPNSTPTLSSFTPATKLSQKSSPSVNDQVDMPDQHTLQVATVASNIINEMKNFEDKKIKIESGTPQGTPYLEHRVGDAVSTATLPEIPAEKSEPLKPASPPSIPPHEYGSNAALQDSAIALTDSAFPESPVIHDGYDLYTSLRRREPKPVSSSPLFRESANVKSIVRPNNVEKSTQPLKPNSNSLPSTVGELILQRSVQRLHKVHGVTKGTFPDYDILEISASDVGTEDLKPLNNRNLATGSKPAVKPKPHFKKPNSTRKNATSPKPIGIFGAQQSGTIEMSDRWREMFQQ